MHRDSALRKRLLPLHAAVALQGAVLWYPVEKLFMSEIGFDALTFGVMAAAYAAMAPLVEIPSGILADRWSRRGVLIVSSTALALGSLIGGLSDNVTVYVLSALIFGVYFAMFSGTLDAILYDTVLEETASSESFEKRLGRIRFTESSALVLSALAGGWLADVTTPRFTYFVTVPLAALSIVAYLRFREPRLHRAEVAVPVRRQIAMTYRTITGRGRLLPIVILVVLTGLTLNAIFEFGPLWLVSLAVPAVLFGPHWAGLMTTLGLGGLLAGRLRLDQPVPLMVVVTLMLAGAVTLSMPVGFVAVTVAQIVLALLLVVASIHVTRLLHDAVPSKIRSGVASGVSALSWIAFLPFALIFGVVNKYQGVNAAGWMIVAVTVVVGVLLLAATRRPPPQVAAEGSGSAATPTREDVAATVER